MPSLLPRPRRSHLWRPAISSALALCMALLAPACSRGRSDAPVEPTAPTASAPAPATVEPSDDLAERLEILTKRVEAARVKHHIPGLALAVVKDDEVILSKGFGAADLAAKRPVTPQTLFAIGSTTKAMSATLIGMLIDEGKMSWDDPVGQYVPEFQLKPRAASTQAPTPVVTLRDVLCHRTGFTRMSLLWISGSITRKQMLSQAGRAEPWADYHAKFLYNNVTYASAGEASARVAGTSWSALLKARLFDPLGMTNSNASVKAANADPHRAQGYRWRAEKEQLEPIPMRDLSVIAPAGAINSNVLDMSKWLRLLLARGQWNGKTLVSAERLEQTWTKQIDMGQGAGYGLGWMLHDWRGHREVEHGGNIDGYAAEVGLLPDDGLGFVMLTNTSFSPLQQGIRGLVWESLLGDLDQLKGDKSPQLDLSPYLGKYVANFGPFKDARFTVSNKDGKLHVDVPGQTNYELRPPDKDGRWSFALTDTIAVSFERDGDGPPQVMRMHQGGLDFELPREGYVPPVEIDLEAARAHLGRYKSDDGKLQATALIRNNRLALDIPGQMVYELHAPDKDGRWAFRVKRDLAVRFNATSSKTTSMTLFQGGQEIELRRVGDAEKDNLPTVAALMKQRKAARFDKRLAKLGTVQMQGKIRSAQSGVEGTFNIIFDAEGRYTSNVDFGEYGSILSVYDGKQAWEKPSFAPLTDHVGKHLTQAALGHPMALLGDLTRVYDKVQVSGRQTAPENTAVAGKQLVLLTLQEGDLPPAKAYVDPKTGEVRVVIQPKLVESIGARPSQSELSDYRRAIGLRLPHRMVNRDTSSGETILEVQSIKPYKGDPTQAFPAPPSSPRAESG